MGHAHEAVEVAKTVLEVAELAWSAVEHLHHHQHKNPNSQFSADEQNYALSGEQLNDLRNENKRLTELLEQNLKLLQNLSSSPCLLNDCPPDLHERIVAAVDSEKFLTRLHSLRDGSDNGDANEFPFKEPTGDDLEAAEILVNVDKEKPSWWVWVTDDMVPGTKEERSGIDDESYVVVCEEHVVDGVANFLARCIVSNPKLQKMEPEQLQKTLTKSLGGFNKVEKMLTIWHAGKMFCALSTWGLALAGSNYKDQMVQGGVGFEQVESFTQYWNITMCLQGVVYRSTRFTIAKMVVPKPYSAETCCPWRSHN